MSKEISTYHELSNRTPFNFEKNSSVLLQDFAQKFKGQVVEDEHGVSNFEIATEGGKITARGKDNGWTFSFEGGPEEAPLRLLATVIKNEKGKEVNALFIGVLGLNEKKEIVQNSWKRYRKDPKLNQRISNLTSILSFSSSS